MDTAQICGSCCGPPVEDVCDPHLREERDREFEALLKAAETANHIFAQTGIPIMGARPNHQLTQPSACRLISRQTHPANATTYTAYRP